MVCGNGFMLVVLVFTHPFPPLSFPSPPLPSPSLPSLPRGWLACAVTHVATSATWPSATCREPCSPMTCRGCPPTSGRLASWRWGVLLGRVGVCGRVVVYIGGWRSVCRWWSVVVYLIGNCIVLQLCVFRCY